MSKKYDVRILQTGSTFRAEVIRRKTSRGTTVERKKSDFVTRQDAETWAQAELKLYLAKRAQHTKNVTSYL